MFGTYFGNCILWLTYNVLVVSTVNSKHVCSTSDENLKCIKNIDPGSLTNDITFHERVKVNWFRILLQKHFNFGAILISNFNDKAGFLRLSLIYFSLSGIHGQSSTSKKVSKNNRGNDQF